jgi:acetylornithine/succinyldiaminopimelate/putrescine aminotransferase
LSATCQEKYQKDFKPLLEGFVSVPFNNISAVKNAISDKTIAVMLELVQGEGGVNVADREFVSQLVRLCKDNGLLTIVDEVQTGIGRTGTMFAWQQYGFVPDIFTLAKALGGGLPIGAMMSRPALADLLTPGTHGSTFGGGPVISKAALAVLRAVQKEKLLSRAQKMGELLRSELLSLKKNSTCVKGVRGLGLMIGVELTVPGKPVVAECMASGLLINCTHDTVLRIMPPLGVSPWEIKQAVGILTNALEKVQS